jgi:Bacterial SH3 domain
MNKLISKLLVLAVGVALNVVAIEATSNHAAMAQRLCQSYRVTRDGGLYVYINAGSEIITTLPYGNIVTVTGMSSDGSWASIEYLRVDGQIGEGWVAADYLACYQQ